MHQGGVFGTRQNNTVTLLLSHVGFVKAMTRQALEINATKKNPFNLSLDCKCEDDVITLENDLVNKVILVYDLYFPTMLLVYDH